MRDKKTLRDLRVGDFAEISNLLSVGGMRRRLMDIGLSPGTRVTCVGKSPAGDPSAYLIRGAVIAIRAQDAQHILISTVENPIER